MHHTRFTAGLLAVALVWPLAHGDEAKPKKDYTEFSRFIQKLALEKVPEFYQDNSGWGQTVPLPENVRLPRLQRTFIKVGKRYEVPDGLWRKVKVWMDKPARDLQITVRDLRPVDKSTYRLSLDTDARLRGEIEGQQWKNGLNLLNFVARADATVNLAIECDVKVTLTGKNLIPGVQVEPTIADLKMDLRDFTLRDASLKRLGVTIQGEAAKQVGDQFKDALGELMKRYEPDVKDYANQAIARSLKEGKGNLSPDVLFKVLGGAR